MMRLAPLAAAVVIAASVDAHAQLRSEIVATGLSSPLQLVADPIAPDVHYVVEQGGLVKVLRSGVVFDIFLDLRGSIGTGGERGLLGMAFDPRPSSSRVFVNFTNASGHTVVARFTRSAANPFRAELTTRIDLQWPTGERFIRQPFSNHNGGHLAFGADGYLYIGLGDGGSGNDPQNHAQNPFSLLGKMLRIDVQVPEADPVGYRVPSDNPFVDGQPIAALAEIWAFGLRNPWRYSFDDLGVGATGALIIGDVGQGAREEINYEPAGAGGRNYGWRLREGLIPTPGIAATTPAYLPLHDPIFDYARSAGQSVTGGYLYRGTQLGAQYHGRYFFADFVTARVWSLGLAVDPPGGDARAVNLIEHTGELGSLGGIASFGRDLAGELYLLTFAGRVIRLAPAAVVTPSAPRNLVASVIGSSVSLSWLPPSSGTPAGYLIEAGSTTGTSNLAVAPLGGALTTQTFAGVGVGTYFVRLRASGTATGPPSNEVIVTIAGAGCTTPPPAPTSLVASVLGGIVTLTWTATSPTAIDAFVLDAGNRSGATDVAQVSLGSGARSFSAAASPGTYFVRVKATSACGSSAASNEVVVTVP